MGDRWHIVRARQAGAGLCMLGILCMVAAVTVSPASASGESTVVSLTAPTSGTASTYAWAYTFSANDGRGLSNVAVRFCSTSILSHVLSASPGGEVFTSGDVPGGHTGFGPGVKFAVTAVTGLLEIVFDQPLAISSSGLEVQSHSGDGQDGDLVTVGFGPGPCAADPTTTVPGPTTTVDPGRQPREHHDDGRPDHHRRTGHHGRIGHDHDVDLHLPGHQRDHHHHRPGPDDHPPREPGDHPPRGPDDH